MSAGLSSYISAPDAIAKNIPLGRMGNDDDMADACIYLSSRRKDVHDVEIFIFESDFFLFENKGKTL
jgi:hypothetical protein